MFGNLCTRTPIRLDNTIIQTHPKTIPKAHRCFCFNLRLVSFTRDCKQPLAKLEEILEVYERFLCHIMPHYATLCHITPHHATSRHIIPHPSTKTINKRHLHQLATTRGIGSTPDPLLRHLQGISRTADLKHIWSDFGRAVINLTA